MYTQDSVLSRVVLAADERERIAKALRNRKAAILQNYGSLLIGSSVFKASIWFLSLERSCQT